MPDAPRLLHVTPTFLTGGVPVRMCQLINHFGSAYRHTVLALDGRFDAARRIRSGVDVEYAVVEASSNPLRMMMALADAMRSCSPRLVLTYNWGSMDAALAALLWRIAPVVHAEDGFGADEAGGQKLRRVLFRRLVLRHAHAVVAPSENLWRIMLQVWRLPAGKTRYIPNGVDTEHFAPVPEAPEPRTELVVGTVGGLRAEKRFDRLIEVCAGLARRYPLRLVIAGDGPERANLLEKAESFGFGPRLELAGHLLDPLQVYRKMDAFALSSSTEQMPYAVLEAMACGLPIVSTDVGDVGNMVSVENRPFVVTAGAAYETAMARLLEDADLRGRLGAANRKRCVETYSLAGMVREYEELYGDALRDPRFPR